MYCFLGSMPHSWGLFLFFCSIFFRNAFGEILRWITFLKLWMCECDYFVLMLHCSFHWSLGSAHFPSELRSIILLSVDVHWTESYSFVRNLLLSGPFEGCSYPALWHVRRCDIWKNISIIFYPSPHSFMVFTSEISTRWMLVLLD